MNTYLGVITKVLDEYNFRCEVTVKGIINERTASPVSVDDKPEIGDAVLVHELDSGTFGFCYFYQKLRIKESTRISLQENIIEITENDITVKTPGSSITLNKSDGGIIIDSSQNLTIKSQGEVKVMASKVILPDRIIEGQSAGAFNAIPICPVLKKAHSKSEW